MCRTRLAWNYATRTCGPSVCPGRDDLPAGKRLHGKSEDDPESSTGSGTMRNCIPLRGRSSRGHKNQATEISLVAPIVERCRRSRRGSPDLSNAKVFVTRCSIGCPSVLAVENCAPDGFGRTHSENRTVLRRKMPHMQKAPFCGDFVHQKAVLRK